MQKIEITTLCKYNKYTYNIIMFYTILGSVIGATACFIIGKCTDMSFRSSSYVPSSGDIFVITGFVLGGSIGFGYGSAYLITGDHPFNTLINYIK